MTDNSSTIDRARALLALETCSGLAQGPRPTESELVDLCEQNLSASRREQVLSHIARNPDVYQQWITLVETREMLAPISSPSTWQSVQGWVKNCFARPLLSGVQPWMGLAASGAFIMVTWLVVSTGGTSDIDSLYADYSEQKPVANGELPYLATRGAQLAVLSETQQFNLYQGLKSGADQLGNTYNLLLTEPVVTGEPVQSIPLLVDLGLVSAIAYVKCQQPSSADFYRDAHTIMIEIQRQLASIDDSTLQSVAKMRSSSESPKEHVCRMAHWSIQALN